MIERFINNVKSLRLFTPVDTVLVGVSGGIDSIVLAELMHRAGYAFAIAHCNFRLRGKESDEDAVFVKALAAKYGKPLFDQSFDTVQFAAERGISIEMAARELRYAWFEEIRHLHHFDCIAVAHHLDDQAETFFLNLARGTGISGLVGMKAVNGKVIRPLLFATRKEIETFAVANRLEYREDSSNQQTDFQRNKIRHLILPLMEELNSSFRDGLLNTMDHLRDTCSVYFQAIELAKERVIIRKTPGKIELSISELRCLEPLSAYLFEILKPWHFNGDVVDEMVKSLDGQPGKQFFSSTHRAIIDRDVILIRKLSPSASGRFYIDESCTRLDYPVKLNISVQYRGSSLNLNTTADKALIDLAKLQFPLILRKWQKGDYFQPLGMKGMKKLSDFFVDEKFSLDEKENAWLLTNGEEVVWIVGTRLDERYKIGPGTTNMLVLELNPAISY